MEMAKRGLLFLHRACSASLTRQDRLDILFGTFFVHLVLTMLSNLCGCLTQSFLLYNGLFLGTVIWSLHHREYEEPPFLFGLVMAMLNLALRPMSAFLLYRVVQDRATDHGGSSTLPSSLQGIFNPTPYEDIDQEGAQAVIPNTQTPRHSKHSKDPIVA
ncbi:hypothetical protein O3P69_004548 [Scylla paramamosain]|uniref:Uncharacterized protein n=1 Tax=Scylla paramamosain TaxID=85552 RepID=A0AAW0UFV2_SCYPA